VDDSAAAMTAVVMRLLAAGVPLSLLADLVAPPISAEVLTHERLPGLPAT
jgi:hypothetical protein